MIFTLLKMLLSVIHCNHGKNEDSLYLRGMRVREHEMARALSRMRQLEHHRGRPADQDTSGLIRRSRSASFRGVGPPYSQDLDRHVRA